MKKLLLLTLLSFAGCSWQGQRACNNDGTVIAEWWSMRLLWVSNGIEAYNETDHWKTGYRAIESQSDSDSIKAAVEPLAEQIMNFTRKGL